MNQHTSKDASTSTQHPKQDDRSSVLLGMNPALATANGIKRSHNGTESTSEQELIDTSQQWLSRGETSFINSGKLCEEITVQNAIKWKQEQESHYMDPRNRLKRALDSIYVQAFIFVLILTDLALFALSGVDHPMYGTITIMILIIYTIEIVLRVYAIGPKAFFKDPLEVFDLVIVALSLILRCTIYARASIVATAARSFKALRVLKVFRSFRLFVRAAKALRAAPKSIRQLVRLNKQGYHDGKFDLDLCYITQHVIAMSLPSSGLEKLYRNPIQDVVTFMDENHGDHYMIFDLCLERSYDYSLFHNRVTHYKFQDHGVPTISNMFKLCEGIAEWLSKDDKNCVAVHCKGGKGRTGTMICAWILFTYKDATPEEAIELFAAMRTNQMESDKYQGVETPSQRRYVEYFYQFIQNPILLNIPPCKLYMTLNEVIIGPLYNAYDTENNANDIKCNEWMVQIIQRDESSATNQSDRQFMLTSGEIQANDTIRFIAKQEELCGNVCIKIIKQSKSGRKMFASLWIHTYFMELDDSNDCRELAIPKLECDKLHKDKDHKKAPLDMTVKLYFENHPDH
eukprot:753498_1